MVCILAAMAFIVAACSPEDTAVESADDGDTATETTEAAADPADDDSGTEDAEEGSTAAVGDTVSAGDMAFTLNGLRLAEGDEFFTPAEGEKWVVLDGTWENRGDEAESVSTLLQFELRVDGRSQDQTITGDENGSLDGDVLPGSTLSGEVAFSVGTDATEGEFLVSVDVFGSPAVYVVALP